MSDDGKIRDINRTATRLPSTADRKHLEQRLAIADATLFGAGTLRAYGTTALIKDATLLEQRHQTHQRPQPIQIVCSRSGHLEPSARFCSQPVPRWLLTTPHGAQSWPTQGPFERGWVAPTRPEENHFDWQLI